MRSLFKLTTLAVATAAMLSVGHSSVSSAANEATNDRDAQSMVANRQSQLARSLPPNLVVRINRVTKQAEVLHSSQGLNARNKAAIAKGNFKAMGLKDKMSGRGELDRDSSSSSWYFFFPNYSYYTPSYYYMGYQYNYVPYTSYYYGGYDYNYYRNPYYYNYGYNGCGYGYGCWY